MRKRALNAPVLHFLMLGFALYLASGWVQGGSVEEIRLDEAKIEALVDDWHVSRGRPPTATEHRALVRAALDEEILYREALRYGLDRAPAVQQRLEKLASFLQVEGGPGDVGGADARARIAQIRTLGLDRTDPAIRGYLVESMRALLRRRLDVATPSEAELQQYYRQHLTRYTQPRRLRFSHVFVGGSGAESQARMAILAARIRQSALPPERAIALGDAFYGGHQFSPRTEAQLAMIFGAEAAGRVSALSTAEWSEPIASVYGEHLVWVEETIDERPRRFEEVRSDVLRAVMAEHEEEAWGRLVEEIRDRPYVIAVMDE